MDKVKNQNDYFKYLNVGLPEDILQEKEAGNLDYAIKLIDKRLESKEISESLRYSLIAHRELIKRLPDSFTVSVNDALERIRKEIPDFSLEDLYEYMDQRRIEWIYINGERKLIRSFFGTLGTYEDFNARKTEFKKTPLEEMHTYKTAKKVREQGYHEIRATIRHHIRIEDSSFEKGKKVLVHIPLPRVQDTQRSVVIDKFYPEGGKIDKEDAICRTISWEKVMDENDEFYVEYTYTNRVEYIDLENKVGEESSDYMEWTKETYPHIVFTPLIRQITNELTSGCKGPLSKARAIYDFITTKMRYSFQRDYFAMANIPERCLRNHRGDCGVFALTFITLCRCAGIPAHWETCFAVEPDGIGRHDWARFYVKPFGWLHADCSYGVGSNTNHNELGRKHYFGNMDAYRMVANIEVNTDFGVVKKMFSADPVDSQMGEIEYEDRGLAVDEFDYKTELIKFEEK